MTSTAAVAPAVVQRSSPNWLVVVAAFFGVMTGFGSLFVFTFGIFLKPLNEQFGWSREAVSSGFGFAALAVAASSPGLGKLLDRFGPRKIIIPFSGILMLTLPRYRFQ